MRLWNDRPPEIAHLFNPAFCAVLIREGVLGFMDVSPGGMPYPLVFLLLPNRVFLGKGQASGKIGAASFIIWAGEKVWSQSTGPDLGRTSMVSQSSG
jgi:hypothetical protein